MKKLIAAFLILACAVCMVYAGGQWFHSSERFTVQGSHVITYATIQSNAPIGFSQRFNMPFKAAYYSAAFIGGATGNVSLGYIPSGGSTTNLVITLAVTNAATDDPSFTFDRDDVMGLQIEVGDALYITNGTGVALTNGAVPFEVDK